MSKSPSMLPRLVTAGFFLVATTTMPRIGLLPEMAAATAQAADTVMPNLCRLL